jgi:hypothetical protein
MGDVTFTTAHMVVLGAIFGPLLTAIGVLFKSLLNAKDSQITLGATALEQALATNKELSAAVAEATTELRELRQDLWRNRRIGEREGPM